MNHRLSLHSTIAGNANLASMVQAAKQVGFPCIEPEYHMLYDYLEAGYSVEQLKALLDGLEVTGVGWLGDIECQGEQFSELLKMAAELFELCGRIGAKGVQLLTGPMDVQAVKAYQTDLAYNGYMGLQHLGKERQLDITSANMAILADMAAPYGITLYLEPLCWTPLGTITMGKELIERTNRHNVALVIDFWQCFTAGTTQAEIASLPKEMIYGVHIGDGHQPDAGIPDEQRLRNVPLGEGVIPIKDWIDAVKSTGFEGWWACESFDRRQNQMAFHDSVKKNYNDLMELVCLEKGKE